MMKNLLTFASVAKKTTQLLSIMARLRLLLVMLLTLCVSAAWGADATVKWTASSGALGSGIGSGTIKTGTFSWDYTRTLKSGSTYTGWTSNCIQLGKNGGVENITFTTSAIPGTIKSVSVECSSYNNAHKVSIKVGNTTYLSSTATPKWTTVSAKTGTGASSGTITISFTDGTRALYIKSISVTYEEQTSACTTNPTVSAGSNSNVTSTTATVSCTGGITSLGSAGCSITSYGFVYGTTTNPTTSNTKVQVGTTYTTTGTAFSKELTGLTANTTYYVRPYATNGNGTAYGTQTSFKTLELPKYTVTLNAGPGTCAASVTEASAGAGVTLPTPTLNGCDEWTFAGWKTTSAVATETTTKPTLIAAGTYKPASNITLYAVYQRTEGGGGTVTWNKVTTAPADWSGEYLIVNSNYAMTSDFHSGTSGEFKGASVTVSNNQVTSSPSDKMIWIVEKNGSSAQYSFKNKSTGTYAKITGTSSTNAALSSSVIWFTISSSSTSGVWKINSVDNSARCFAYYSTNKTFRTYANSSNTTGSLYKKEGSGSTTYYYSYPQCITETVVTLDPNGGAIDDDSNTQEIQTENGTLFLPTPTRVGYTFTGWNREENGSGDTFDAGENTNWDESITTLYAQWECDIPEFTLTSTTFARTEGQEIRIASNATNVPANAKFTWYLNGAEVANQSSSELYIASCTIADAGSYTCTISYDDCSFDSENNYSVKVYSVRGLKGEWDTFHPFVSTSDTEGEFTIYLDANTSFKVWDGEYYYGNPESGTMSGTSENWTMQQNFGGDVTLTNIIAGTYTFKLDYSDASNTKISVYYPSKITVYLNPVSGDAGPYYAIHTWDGSNTENLFMEKVDDCDPYRNIYKAEINASHKNLIFVSTKASTVADMWNQKNYQTIDLTYPTDNDKMLFDMSKLYLTPNSNWKQADARFAAYFFGNGDTWVSMTKVTDNLYEVAIPTNKDYPNVIFCRMNPSSAANNWDNKWNQSPDLTITKDKNHYTITEGQDNWSNGTWSTDGYWTTYTPNHTVSFNANGHGTAPEDQCITDGDKATNPGNLSAIGYTFGGWYKEVGCTNAWDFANDVVTEDIILYAKWIANTNTAYTVKHYQENIDGTYPATPTDTDNLTGTTATSVTPAVKDYTGFTAPSTQTVTIAADGSTVVEYKYTRNSYTLTWNLAGGEITEAGTNAGPVKYGTPLTAPTVTKSGLTFIGWSPEVPATMPADVATYTAIWENCIWVETTTIEDGDEIVFIMVDNTTSTSYAMNNEVTTSSNPLAIEINTDIFSSGYVPNNIIWDIQKDVNGIVFYSKTAAESYLRCNAKPNVRVGVGANNTFTLDNGYIRSLSYDDSYLAVATGATTKDWRQYGYSSGNITNQTLKFYKRVCLPEGQYWVKWMFNGQEYTEGDPTTMVTDGQITDVPDKPADDAIGDCADTFMGWSESNLGSTEGQSAPTDLFTTLAEAQELTITENKTFYAVFATASGTSNIFSRVTDLSQLEDGNTLAIVAEQSGGQIFGTGSDHKGGAAPGESDGKITISVSTNKWILEEVDGGWKLLKDENNKLCADLGYTAYGNTLTIEDSQTDKYFFVRSSNKYLEYYSNAWQFFQINNTPTSNQNGYVRLKIYKSNVTYSNYVTNCCALAPATNLTVSGTTANSATLTWTAPSPTTGITKLQVRDENGNVKVDNLAANATTATITGLTECTSYKYYVVSVGDCEVFSNTVTATPFSGAKTVNYNYNGGSGSPESFTTSCDDDKREIILPVATRPGYTFEGWYDSEENKVGDAGATYDPATSPITLYAHWTENTYQLIHSGSNYTITENKTSIKSSDTPFALHYTCTGDYGLPATISITGGGKSWTIDTDYTWEVAADKQSATLVIKETVISADVTITINVATRYTVTFVHNDKGVFSGSETIEVLSSENTITLPTVTDVSCGFYDTFEGWIVANEDYTESTSKPAGTIYKGGANYTVNGDCTLRALYSKCEGDATQVYRKVTTTGDVTDGTYILVANTATPLVYSGHTDGKDYGDCISGLTPDESDFSNSLPNGAVPVTISVGVSGFSIHNGTKFIVAGTSTGVSDNASYWQLTDGSQVDSKACPQGVLQPVNNTTYVLQKNNSLDRFKTYENSQSAYVFLYKLIDKCTKYYSTNPSCEKPVGVHIVYNANAVDASMSCIEQNKTYKVENEVNKYPQLASQLQFCTNATREGYTLVGWNTQSNGQGTTYNINQNYYNLPVSGELDDYKWITLYLYAMWKPCIKFNLGNATGGTGVPDAVVENGECVLPTPTAEQLGTIPCGYEFYAWSETSVNATQTKPALFMPGDTYSGDALTLYAVYRWCEGNTGSDTYYFTFIVDGKTYCITQKHNNYDRFVVAEATTGLVFGLENDYLYYLDENGTKNYVYYGGSSTTVTTTTTYPNADTQKTTFVEGDNGTTIVEPAINNGNRTLQFTGTGNISDYYDRAYYTTGGTNPTLVEVQSSTCTYATNPTCYTNTNLHFVTNGGTLNYPTDYNETNYQELAIGDDILLPTATFAGEWTFEGWKRGAPLETTTTKPYDPTFYSVTLNTTQFEVDALGDIYFYAVYSKTNDDKQFDPVNGGTYKLFAIGADGTKTYMPVWTGTRGTPSGVTTCAETGDYTITPGTGTHAGQYQITCGEYTLGVVSGNTDLKEVEGTWWNIEPSTSGKGTWRITVVGSTDDRALICSFSTAKSFGNYAISNLNNPSQTIYRDMEIGECIYTEYTSTPENIPYITITGAPVKITSTNGERVYASTTVHIEAHNFTGERIIHLSATNGFGVDPVQVRTNGQGAYSGNVKVYYEPTTDGDGQTITSSVLTASQTGGTNAEKINQTFAAIQGRNMPANFVIAAKWDGLWYALPANCTSSNSSTEGLLIEVDDVDNPTKATSAPASAKYGIREVIPSRQTDYGQGVVFTERYSDDNKEYSLYNNGTSANLQVYSQYSNYAQTNPDKYEWIPTTSDFNEYTLTNASTGRNLGLTSGTFGAYTAASNQVRLLPATFYEPATAQVLKWKANSVIVMYTGAETTATTQIGNNAASDKQTLADQQLTHGIYELTTNQALTNNAGGALKLNFGENTRVELEIPLIISGRVTASANAHDVVILENSKLTAAATKYSYKDVYVYGGGKLAIPTGTTLGVNNIILRAGGVATDGAGQNATYQYIYPQVELKGTLTSAVQNIRYEYVTDNDHWYHLALPFDGSLASIHYPYEYYGDQVELDNNGSWQIKRYAGEIRATGNYDAWVDIETEGETSTIAGQGYIFWGAPKIVSVNGGASTRQKWGIQRITMSVTAPNAMTAENGDKAISELSSYANVPNNSGKDNDQGWNLIGNPYMVNLKDMETAGLHACKLVEVIDPATGKWNGQWEWNNETDIRYLTIPSDHFDTYTAKTVAQSVPLVPGRAFFVQLEGEANAITFAAANRASLMPALRAANDKPVDIETGIILSNETLQDEVNFWIKDGKTNDYEYNADYPKTPNNNQFNIYGVHTNGDLSWVATGPEYAAESMPIGYQVPAAGTYMLSLSEIYNSDGLDALYVTDHAPSPEVTVDIMSEPYEFSVNQSETNNERFTVSVRVKAKTENGATGLGNVGADGEQIHKFIYQDKIFILHHGVIYDATGKRVITINK